MQVGKQAYQDHSVMCDEFHAVCNANIELVCYLVATFSYEIRICVKYTPPR